MVEGAVKAIVIDNGSGMIKAGLSGEDKPRTVFPSVVGYPKEKSVMPGDNPKEIYIGSEAQKYRGVLNIKYPIEHGIVNSWDEMTKIWQHTCANELRVDPADYYIMLTEAPMNPKANREKMIDICFSTFNCKGFYVGLQAVLAMFSAGKVTGLVLDSGDGVTHAVPIFETYSVPSAIKKIMLAGRDITKWLEHIIQERGFTFETTAQFEIVREIKESMSYVSLNYKKDMDESPTKEWKEANNKTYTLPDGNLMELGNERFRTPELMFQPTLYGRDLPGIHKLALEAIMGCDLDVRKSLWENVILSGGSTMFPNYPERLLQELKVLAPPSIKVQVFGNPERKYAVFLGAALLASFSSFANMWVTKQEFDENGPSIVHRKCF